MWECDHFPPTAKKKLRRVVCFKGIADHVELYTTWLLWPEELTVAMFSQYLLKRFFYGESVMLSVRFLLKVIYNILI